MEKSSNQELIEWDEEMQTNVNKGFCSPDDVLNLSGDQMDNVRLSQRGSGGDDSINFDVHCVTNLEEMNDRASREQHLSVCIEGVMGADCLRTPLSSKTEVECENQFEDSSGTKPVSPLEQQGNIGHIEAIGSEEGPIVTKLEPVLTHSVLAENLRTFGENTRSQLNNHASSFSACLPDSILDGINLNVSEVGRRVLLAPYTQKEHDIPTMNTVQSTAVDRILYGFDLTCERDGDEYSSLDQMTYDYDVTCGEEEVQYTSLDPVSYSFDVSCEADEDLNTSVDPMSYEFEVSCTRDDEEIPCFSQNSLDNGKNVDDPTASVSCEKAINNAYGAVQSWPNTELIIGSLEHQSSVENSSSVLALRNEGSCKRVAVTEISVNVPRDQILPTKDVHERGQVLTSLGKDCIPAEMKEYPAYCEPAPVRYHEHLSTSKDRQPSQSAMDERFSEQRDGGSVEPTNTSVTNYTLSLCQAASWDCSSAIGTDCVEELSQFSAKSSVEHGMESSQATSVQSSQRSSSLEGCDKLDVPGMHSAERPCVASQVVLATERETEAIQSAAPLFAANAQLPDDKEMPQGSTASTNRKAMNASVLAQTGLNVSPARKEEVVGAADMLSSVDASSLVSAHPSNSGELSNLTSISMEIMGRPKPETFQAGNLNIAEGRMGVSNSSDSEGTSKVLSLAVNEERAAFEESAALNESVCSPKPLATVTSLDRKQELEQVGNCLGLLKKDSKRTYLVSGKRNEKEEQFAQGAEESKSKELPIECKAISRETSAALTASESEETFKQSLDLSGEHSKVSKYLNVNRDYRVDCAKPLLTPVMELMLSSASIGEKDPRGVPTVAATRNPVPSGEPSLYTCTKCSVYFQDREYLHRHMLDHFDGHAEEGFAGAPRPFTCHECGHAFCDLASLQTHLSLHQERRASFMEAFQELADPRGEGHGAKQQVTFGTSPAKLPGERAEVHVLKVPHQCHLCHFQAATAEGFQEHQWRNHPGGVEKSKSPCTSSLGLPTQAAKADLHLNQECPSSRRVESLYKEQMKLSQQHIHQQKSGCPPTRPLWPSAGQGADDSYNQSSNCESSPRFLPLNNLGDGKPELESLPSTARGLCSYEDNRPVIFEGEQKGKTILDVPEVEIAKLKTHSALDMTKRAVLQNRQFKSPVGVPNYTGLCESTGTNIPHLPRGNFAPQQGAVCPSREQLKNKIEGGGEYHAGQRTALTYRKIVIDHFASRMGTGGPSVHKDIVRLKTDLEETVRNKTCSVSFGLRDSLQQKTSGLAGHRIQICDTTALPTKKGRMSTNPSATSCWPRAVRKRTKELLKTINIPQDLSVDQHQQLVRMTSIILLAKTESQSECDSALEEEALGSSMEPKEGQLHREPGASQLQREREVSQLQRQPGASQSQHLGRRSQNDPREALSQREPNCDERELASSVEVGLDKSIPWEVPSEDLPLDLMKKSKDLLGKNLLRMFPLEERECPYCPDKFHTGIGLANHVRGHLKRVGISYNTRHFISAEEVTAIEKEFSLQRLKRKALKIRGSAVERCNLCGANFDSRAGMSSHARAHLRELGVMSWSATSSPIDLLNELLQDLTPSSLADSQPRLDSSLWKPAGYRSGATTSDGSNPRPLVRPFTSANNSSPPLRNTVVIIDPDDDEMTSLALDLPSGRSSTESEIQEKNGLSGSPDTNSQTTSVLSKPPLPKIALVTQGEDSLQSNKLLNSCQLCGTCFETRKGLSSHARFHLRQFGVPDSESSGAPIGTLYELMKRKGIPSVLPSTLATDKPQSCSPKDMSALKQETPGKPLGEECQGETAHAAKSPKLTITSPLKGQSQTGSSTLKKVHPILPKPVSSKSPEPGKTGRSLMDTPQTSGELMSKKLFWTPQDDNTPLNLTVNSEHISCRLCGACFETRKGLSSHSRAHLRHFGAVDVDSKGSPIEALNEFIKKKGIQSAVSSMLPIKKAHSYPKMSALKADRTNFKLGAPVNKKASLTSPSVSPQKKLKQVTMSVHMESGISQASRPNNELAAETYWPSSPINLSIDSAPSKETRCEFCGDYFENRKGLSSHARSHLRQFGVTEWTVNGSPIDTLKELMKRKMHPLDSPITPDLKMPSKPAPMQALQSEPFSPSPGKSSKFSLTIPSVRQVPSASLVPKKVQGQFFSPPSLKKLKLTPLKKVKQEHFTIEYNPEESATLLKSNSYLSEQMWSSSEDTSPLRLTVDQPNKDVRCEFCGEYFENRKGLSSHARSHLRQFGVTEWTVNGSPIDTLKELMKRKGKPEPLSHESVQQELQRDPENYLYEEKPISKPFNQLIKSSGKEVQQKHLTSTARKVLSYMPSSQHVTGSPLGKKIPMGFVSTAPLKKPMLDDRNLTPELKPGYAPGSGLFKPKATWSPQEKVATSPVIAADTCCELCGHYFENRKALASHARAHLRQFGVTEWHINGSPIDTLREWIRQKPNIGTGASLNCVQDRPLPKPIRNSIKSVVKELSGDLCSLPGGKTVKLEPMQPKTVELGFPASPIQKNPETEKMPPTECYIPTDLSQGSITECTPSSSMPSEDDEPHPKKKRKHPVKLGTCEYCGVTLTTGVGLSNHMRGHLKSGLKRKLPSLSQFEELHEKAEPALTDTYCERKQHKPVVCTANVSPKREEGKETKTFRPKSEEPRPPRVRPVIFPVPKPEPISLVKFIGNIYTLKCRFCDVEFHGPLSIQEEWVRHLQRHILDMNFPKTEAAREEISVSADTGK
ncbi:uncharacterized protein LOC125447520 isoform X3 [Stegostoma tigrinum]|uniref:uncharacterized protein LOC125447520 isoform X3 n=1 Tax=Stegostoma tigrinum TaxID=3053191 RepID=UPI00287046F0|nr:uncharacterized protein LOC125447520 isoform X3 [Stegostoma tigrinum]